MVLLLAVLPRAGWACAACYGQSDSPLAAGMNWGIFSLLGFIGVVLGGVAAFFVFLARRSAAAAKVAPASKAEQTVLMASVRIPNSWNMSAERGVLGPPGVNGGSNARVNVVAI